MLLGSVQLRQMGNARLGSPSGAISWDTAVVCTQSGDMVSYMCPRQPAPMGPEAASKLSRAAQLSAVQAVGVPTLPAFSGQQGGVVRERLMQFQAVTEALTVPLAAGCHRCSRA